MRIGIAFDLKSDFEASGAGGPEDAFEEYDSEETVDAIAGALRAAGHDVVKLGGGRRFLERALANPDREMVFNLAEGRGTRSREAHVPAICEVLGIPFTHSDPLTLALTLDKALAKRVVASHGIPTAAFALIERPEDLDGPGGLALPPFPVIAKPNYEGSSMGIRKSSRCEDVRSLRERAGQLLSEYRQPVLVEKFLTGMECTVGVLGNGPDARVVNVMEVAPRRGPREGFIYSLEVKRNWREEVEYHVPARVAPHVRAAIEKAALDAYRALGCRDVSRMDIRLDADGTPCFMEVNPLPGLNPTTGDLAILCARSGLPYEGLIARIVSNAVARQTATAAAPATA